METATCPHCGYTREYRKIGLKLCDQCGKYFLTPREQVEAALPRAKEMINASA